MKFKFLLTAAVLGFVLLALYPKKFSTSDLSSREPTGFFTTGLLALSEDIYTTVTTLGNIPVKGIKNLALTIAKDRYLAKLPLSDDLRNRVESRLNDDRYMTKLVPFLMTLKTQYSEPKIAAEAKFDNYIRTSGQNLKKIPGSEHELFSWKEKEKTDGGLALSEDLVAQLIGIYDAIFIQGDSTIANDENLEKPFKPLGESDQKIIDRTKPYVRNLLLKVKENAEKEKKGKTDPGAANSEAMQMLAILLTNDEKLEAATISVIDFVKYMVHKSYRYFALRLIRESDLNKWLNDKLERGKYDDIIKYLNESDNKRYGVQIGVDGLQGSLLRALAQPEKNQKFLAAALNDFQVADSQKPKSEPTAAPNHVHNTQFLSYLYKTKKSPPNYLPFFKFLFANYSQNISTGGISTTPTISVRNLPIIFTGAEVAGEHSTGIPNFHFVDRKEKRAYYFFGNDALQLETIAKRSGMITMFERLRGISSLNCNAQYEWHSQASFDGLLNLGIGEGSRDFGEVRCYNELLLRASKEVEARSARKELRKLMDEIKSGIFTSERYRARQIIDKLAGLEQDGLPQYLLTYIPWPDHFAHFKGPFSNEILSATGELNRLDYWLAKYADAYKRGDVYKQTLFGMAGDHGLAPIFYTLNPETTVLEELAKDLHRPIKVKKISSDEGEGPKINHNIRPETMKNYDVVIASTAGGNYMMDFFNGQDDRSWSEQPVYADLTKLKLLDGGKPLDIVNEINSRLSETLDYMVIRETKCDPRECHVHVVSTRDGQRVDEFIIRKGNRILYIPYDFAHEKSLMDIEDLNPYREASEKDLATRSSLLNECLRKPNPDDENTWCDENSWRTLASFTPRPDSVVQIAHIYDEDRSGTVNLFPRYGVGYNTKVPGRHAGESFHEKDAFLGFWGEPTSLDFNKSLGPAVNGSLAPTIYSFLSGADLTKNRAGFGFRTLWNEIKK